MMREAGRWQEAIASYLEALRLKPAYPEAHQNLGDLHHELGRLHEAIRHCEMALELMPESLGAKRGRCIAQLAILHDEPEDLAAGRERYRDSVGWSGCNSTLKAVRHGLSLRCPAD